MSMSMSMLVPLSEAKESMTQIAADEHSAPNNRSNQSIMSLTVRPGHPVGQLYGLQAPWTQKTHQKKSFRTKDGKNNYFDLNDICGRNSACFDVDLKEGKSHYAIGPPYLVHMSDFPRLVDTWVKMVPKVHEGYPHLLAEMYAYSLAAAHEKLPHTTVVNHMISNVDSPDGAEGWSAIDSLHDDVCQAPQKVAVTISNTNANTMMYYPMSANMPTFLHYNQFYRIGVYGFQKRRVHISMFQCNSPLLMEPPLTVGQTRVKIKDEGEIVKLNPITARRNAFMVCAISSSINMAVLDVKTRMCNAGGDGHGRVNVVHEPLGGDRYDVVNTTKSINLALQF